MTQVIIITKQEMTQINLKMDKRQIDRTIYKWSINI